ncbi:MAG: CbiX/SirB N-terminal domain-containing protein [archaeon]|nr:CbiX/SirB N-terminal domain-containing protein [archaeon]
MEKIKRTSAVVVIPCILLLGALVLSALPAEGIQGGIGDTPYEITEDNHDEYPLVERNENYEQIGILVVAHGSPRESWCKPVKEAVENVSLGYPTEVGFLEFVENLTGYDFIHEAVDKLDEQNVTKIIAVPLFISSSSGHIAEIEYVLRLREELPDGEEEKELVQVDTPAEIVLTNAMDDHSFIAQILADRAAGLCDDPANETVVIVGHGELEETDFEGWVNSSKSLAEKIKLILRHSKGINIENVTYSFIHQPEDYPVNLTVRTVVENVSTTSYPVVVPLMVSEGFFTDRYIPSMLLAGLDYAYPEKGKRALTPHPNVANWIEVTAAKEFVYPTVLIYDEEELQEISLAEVGAHHGKICPCVAFAFRSTLRAFSEEELWDGIPHRGDVKIVCAHPSDGHQKTFEYILNSTEDVVIELPPGTDIINITADNYVYTFINKSTNESVTLRVKEDIFPERFFELRTKNKLGTATPEEKKAFKLLWEELKEKAMYKPLDRVFKELGTGFETGEGTYPSIFGVHEGTITPLHNVIADKMYTYPCVGTGGHSEHVRIYNESRTVAEAHWNGYTGDYHNISFDTTFILEAGKKYNYTIRTGSYPQIHHTDRLETSDGVIECTQFVDANGKRYNDWIPAIRLFY